jgi:acyl-CoA dehydrogenase
VAVHRRAELELSRIPCPSAEPRYRIAPGGTPGHAAHGGDDCALLVRVAALLRAAQSLGALEWSLARTVGHVTERRQFGREIAQFQAVQQQLAEFAGACTAAAVSVEAAVLAGAAAAHRAATAAACARLAEAVDTGVYIAHQLHGAIGFSSEYPLNHRTRRLMAWRGEFGSPEFWGTALARRALERGPLWFSITAA